MDRDLNDATREELKQDLDSLHEQLADKINEYGNIIRNGSNNDDKQMIEHLNVLKNDQFRLREKMEKIYGCDDPEWNKFKQETEKTVEEVRNNLQREIPA